MTIYYAPIEDNIYEVQELGIPFDALPCLVYPAATDEDKNIFIKFDKDKEPTRFFKGKRGDPLYIEVDEPDLVFDKKTIGFILDFTEGDIASNGRVHTSIFPRGGSSNFYAAKKISDNEIYIFSHFTSICNLSGITGKTIVVYRYEPKELFLQPLCYCQLYKKNGADPELVQVIGEDPYFQFQKWQEGIDEDKYFELMEKFYQSKVITKGLP